ncbi:MAG: DoxX family membrane protein [bacterium]|nr:DoxX family membrane protein [bacterium]
MKYTLAILRILLGWIFFWAFLDKLFGLGLATAKEQSWLNNISPTANFLRFAVSGPFKELFQNLAGLAIVDWLFMLGLLLIGLALILGIATKIATYSGVLMLFLMYLATLPLEHNPIIDEHIIYIFTLFVLKSTKAADNFGLGNWWKNTKLVQKYKFLE